MKKIAGKDVKNLLDQWQQGHSVLVPSRNSGVATMVAWEGQGTEFLEWYRNTVVPPKNSFLQNMEKMFDIRKGENGYELEVPVDDSKQLLFGVRPCDARALSIIDMVFKDAYEDTYYLDRRKNAVLVGLGCVNPYDSCFCTSLGSGPMDSSVVDLMFINIGDDYLIEEVTDKGREMIPGTQGLAEASAEEEARLVEVRDAANQKMTRKIDTAEIGKNLPAAFDNEKFWEKIAAKCVSCGICTFLCPTCYCFDINDEMTRGKGARYRNWDCCSFPVYTKMPAENPREEKWRRVRQKVNHKYIFYPMLFDVIACTGCGRCIRMCPVNWDITQTLESTSVGAAAGMESSHAD